MKLHTINLRRRLWADANEWVSAHPVMFGVCGMLLAGALLALQ